MEDSGRRKMSPRGEEGRSLNTMLIVGIILVVISVRAFYERLFSKYDGILGAMPWTVQWVVFCIGIGIILNVIVDYYT